MDHIIAKLLTWIGAIILISGGISLTVLQFTLTGRLRKNMWTILSAMFYQSHELIENEKRLERVANIKKAEGGMFENRAFEAGLFSPQISLSSEYRLGQ